MFLFSSMFKFGVVLDKLRQVYCFCCLSFQSADLRLSPVWLYVNVRDIQTAVSFVKIDLS